jgi:hypothetical protein
MIVNKELKMTFNLEYELAIACANGEFCIAKSLLKKGVSPSGALKDAIECFQPDMIYLLVEYGANPNAKINGIYPLDLAQYVATYSFMSRDNYEQVYKALLDSGAREKTTDLDYTLEHMLKEIRIKERAKTYLCVSKVLPLDLAQMVAECF